MKSVEHRRRSGKRGARGDDIALVWVEREYPQLNVWRELAAAWMKGETRGVAQRLNSLKAFLEDYLLKHNLPLEPAVFLSRKLGILPDFFATVCSPNPRGINTNNDVHAFLEFVLLRECSATDDFGRLAILPGFYNPVIRRSHAGLPRLEESVRTPLPYGYIEELRQILAPGPDFRDWHWALSALGIQGPRGKPGPDWFEVTEADIDVTDPDCVWRRRDRMKYHGGPILEMWSPVRAVALLIKLIVPLRTMQVRMLDSGEADTWRYDSDPRTRAAVWSLNEHPGTAHLREGTPSRPHRQGVFRQPRTVRADDAESVVLYVNTNKTADTTRSGQEKGYVTPWVIGGPPHSDALYWLEKLRNWQIKYNPIARRSSWTELDNRHMMAKSDVVLAGYPDTCFLFRLREALVHERHLPVSEKAIQNLWRALLSHLQEKLAARGEVHRNGDPIRFVPDTPGKRFTTTTFFPLHSLRVSLVSALALEGRVPFAILQKLVGHSRLLMTLYYTKPGASHVREALTEAAAHLESLREAGIQDFLANTEHSQLVREAISNSSSSLAVAIPEHPASRNPAGWMPMHHGLCLMGGNTGEVEGSRSVGGCYNGGPELGPFRAHGPVPGGARNCVRCRWFVTSAGYLTAMVAHFNNLAYHFDEARNACIVNEASLQELKREKVDAEDSGTPFGRMDVFRRAERVWEASMARFSELAEDLVACCRLVERCQQAVNTGAAGGQALISAGTALDLQIACEDTESELLQLSGVCANAEVYPDLQPGKAVFRRSQLLDAALFRDGLPPLFMMMSEQEQLRAGNTFLRQLGAQMSPSEPLLGQRKVIDLVDAGKKLSEHFGIDLASLLPPSGPGLAQPVFQLSTE